MRAIHDDCKVPVIASGGPTEETIRETIDAGADVIPYSPPPIEELMAELMSKYRNMV